MEKGNTGSTSSILSQEVRLEGDIQGSETLQIEGQLKGSVKLTGGDIYIGPTGIVEADIEADNVVVQGEIHGNVTARKQLQIQSTGKLRGDCTAQSIDIKEGALFEGRSTMKR
ncbi:hypothetical protein D1AOALGA4SA_1919 [Olavius algarvensis Delta 1 endosymbiont]|nr:hypothetical protein D1AOALGA4SA_1919 [Olavius algarvensis Delta 1 endosymbiont]